MNCTLCTARSCRSTVSCGAETFDPDSLVCDYREDRNASIVESAARLVDGGRAGTLDRVQELVEYIRDQGLKKVGLAYCYGMEKQAARARVRLRESGAKVEAVSCTVGALPQNLVNSKSELKGVSCNPLGQAAQLNAMRPDLTVTMGLCLGHDILFNRYIEGDVTTLAVKDRVHGHSPLKGL